MFFTSGRKKTLADVKRTLDLRGAQRPPGLVLQNGLGRFGLESRWEPTCRSDRRESGISEINVHPGRVFFTSGRKKNTPRQSDLILKSGDPVPTGSEPPRGEVFFTSGPQKCFFTSGRKKTVSYASRYSPPSYTCAL